MPRHWIVKKSHEWLYVIVFALVGMSILMSLMMYIGTQAAK
jgi:hypothetical protein